MVMEDLTELIRGVKEYDWGGNGASLLLIDAEIRKRVGHPEQMAKLESALITVLESDAPAAAKRAVCKRLGLIAGPRAVPVLAAMLTRPETSDMARYSLERMRIPAVDVVLRRALGATSGEVRVGIIHSIGYRGDAHAVRALADVLDDSDAAAAQAAAWALGRIGGPEAIQRLGGRRNLAQGRVRQEVLDAYLVCARRLAGEGKKAEAVGMYKELDADDMPPVIRRAAALGLKAAQGPGT
jgi:hypothetical protein